MEVQAQTVTAITAAVDETALAADSMSDTIAAIREDTEAVASEIDTLEQRLRRGRRPARHAAGRRRRFRAQRRRLMRACRGFAAAATRRGVRRRYGAA